MVARGPSTHCRLLPKEQEVDVISVSSTQRVQNPAPSPILCNQQNLLGPQKAGAAAERKAQEQQPGSATAPSPG